MPGKRCEETGAKEKTGLKKKRKKVHRKQQMYTSRNKRKRTKKQDQFNPLEVINI